jgi:hypothetical protein
VPIAALLTLAVAAVPASCGSSHGADDDDDSHAGEGGDGTGGAGEAGSPARGGEGGEGGAGEAGGASGGDAGTGTNAGRGGTGVAGRGGASGGSGGGGGRSGGSGGGSGEGGTGGKAGDGGAGSGTAGAGGAGTAGSGTAGSSGAGGASSSIVTFLAGEYRESLADGTSYLFDEVSLATPGPDRLLVVTAHAATNAVASFSSLTIGGVAAQKVASVGEDVQPSAPTAFFVARLPAGEQADIQLVLSTGVVRAAIGVFALYGAASATPFDSGVATSMGGAAIPLDVPQGGVVLAALGMADAASADASWADMFELYDVVMVEGTPTHVSGALRVASPAATTFDVLASTPTAGYATRAVAASFR